MPSIQAPQQAPQFDESLRNQVISAVPVTMLAVKWANGEGRIGICLVLSFGKDHEDDGPGVFILADEPQMKDQLRLANSTVKKGVRQWLAAQKETEAGDVPQSVSEITIEEPMESPVEEKSEDTDPLAGILP